MLTVAQTSSRRQYILANRTVRIVQIHVVLAGRRQLFLGWRDHHVIVVLVGCLNGNIHHEPRLGDGRYNKMAHQRQDIRRHTRAVGHDTAALRLSHHSGHTKKGGVGLDEVPYNSNHTVR
jgi:hypothetical protein